MEFSKDTPIYGYETRKEGGEDVLYINYKGAQYVPRLEDSEEVMSRTMDSLIENPNVSRIVFVQQKNYNYDNEETMMLLEISQLYVYLIKQEKILSQRRLMTYEQNEFSRRYNNVFSFLFLLKKDPVAAYVDVKNMVVEEKIRLESLSGRMRSEEIGFINLLEKILNYLEDNKLIQKVKPYLGDYSKGDRDIYNKLFRADVIPNFTFTRLVSDMPDDAEIIDQYKIFNNEYDTSDVTILRKKNQSKLIYHLSPPENNLSEDENVLLKLGRNVLMQHQPKAEEMTDTERTRNIFFNIAKDLLRDLANSKGIQINYSDLNKLSTILVRNTIGFGLIEVLLQDKNLQDITLNSPIPQVNIFVKHNEHDECSTNILPSQEDANSWAAKFRMMSGRPLDEANPILDTQLEIGNLRARISIVQNPLSPDGLAYSIRRHREDPWTFSLFINNKMINPMAAGLLSFLIDGSRTLLVAGTRSSGKCVDSNTMIQMSNGDIKRIKDLIGSEKKEIEDGKIYYPNSKSFVPSLNPKTLCVEDKKITDVWRREAPKKLIEIKTNSGKKILTTPEHPYFVYCGELKNKRADELKTGSLIASPRRVITRNKKREQINLKKRFKDNIFKETKEFYFLKGGTNSSKVRFPKKLSPELAEFIGMILGDGNINLHKVEFHNSCNELRERYISLLKVFNLNYRIFNSHSTTVVQVTSRILNNILKEVFELDFGKKSNIIKIPSIILKSDNEVLSRFLRGYFDCDGYISENKRDIELLTGSKEMSENLRLALLRFGIVLFTKQKRLRGRTYYRNLIRGEFVENYIKEISFFHPFKKKRAQEILKNGYLGNTNIDTIPQGNKIIKDLRKRLRISPKQFRTSGKDYWSYENNKYRITRNWFKKIINFYQERFEYLASKKEQLELLRRTLDFDYKGYIEGISKIRKIFGISYSALALKTGFSEKGIRKILDQERVGSLENLNKLFNVRKFFETKFHEMKDLQNINPEIKNINKFVSLGIVTYSGISSYTGIPETSIKYYSYSGGCKRVSKHKKEKIEEYLKKIKEEFLARVGEAKKILQNIFLGKDLINSFKARQVLENLRKELNIKNSEVVEEGLSLGTIENFFDKVYNPSFNTLRKISRKILNIYDKSVSGETLKKINEAKSLANSDIFWDRVLSVKEISCSEKYVYDLTVKDAHSFVANGFIAHNTSLLGSMLLEIVPKYRIITVEDSVTRDANIIVKEGSNFRKTTVGNLIDNKIKQNGYLDRDGREKCLNYDNTKVFSINKEGKTVLTKPSKFIRHKTNKQIYEVETVSGKKIKVTEDHSLFSLDPKKIIKPIKCKDLKKGNFIAVTNSIDKSKNSKDLKVFQEKIKYIKKVPYNDCVYDISVPRGENFVCNNIVAHNTLELPVESMRDLKFNVLRMKVRSALMKGSNEIEAAEGIRSSLRLGDSCLIVGEVRSEEARALYEAMRVGALANVVAGTIHGASPYGVFDRVVNDLDVPATSFKATDIIVVCNPVKSADGLSFWRRVVRISEIRKHWEKDPMEEGGFVDLMKYNVDTDELEPTEELINGESEIVKDVAGDVKGWAGNWDAVWDNIELRGKVKKALVDKAKETGNNEIMESEFNVLANHAYHRISNEVIEECGLPWSDKVFPKWKDWLDKEVEKRFQR